MTIFFLISLMFIFMGDVKNKNQFQLDKDKCIIAKNILLLMG